MHILEVVEFLFVYLDSLKFGILYYSFNRVIYCGSGL